MRAPSGSGARALVRFVLVFTLAAGLGAASLGCGGSPASTPSKTVTYQLVCTNGQQPTGSELDTLLSVLQHRIRSVGLPGVLVRGVPPDRIEIGVPPGTDRASVEAITVPGRLTVVPLPASVYGTYSAPGPKAVPADGDTIDPTLQPLLYGWMFDASQVEAVNDPASGAWVVDFGLNEQGTDALASFTADHVGDLIAITLDGKVLSAPYIQSPITDGKGIIAGNFTEQMATQLAAILRSGALPYPLQEIGVKEGW